MSTRPDQPRGADAARARLAAQGRPTLGDVCRARAEAERDRHDDETPHSFGESRQHRPASSMKWFTFLDDATRQFVQINLAAVTYCEIGTVFVRRLRREWRPGRPIGREFSPHESGAAVFHFVDGAEQRFRVTYEDAVALNRMLDPREAAAER